MAGPVYETTLSVDGWEVDVLAEEFESMPGVPYGPTCISASLYGVEFPLTQEQQDEIAIKATQWGHDDHWQD